MTSRAPARRWVRGIVVTLLCLGVLAGSLATLAIGMFLTTVQIFGGPGPHDFAMAAGAATVGAMVLGLAFWAARHHGAEHWLQLLSGGGAVIFLVLLGSWAAQSLGGGRDSLAYYLHGLDVGTRWVAPALFVFCASAAVVHAVFDRPSRSGVLE